MANKRINFDAPRKRALNATNGDKLIDQSTFFQLYDVPLVSPPADGKKTMHKLENFKVGQKAIYDNGKMQLTGIIKPCGGSGELVFDPGLGNAFVVSPENTGHLRLIGEDEWEKHVESRLVLAKMTTKDHFLRLQDRLNQLNAAVAKGEDEIDGVNAQIYSIATLLDRAPWMMHPDKGCIPKTNELMTELLSQTSLSAFAAEGPSDRKAMLLSTPAARVAEFNIFQKKALEVYNAGNHLVKTPDDVAGFADPLLRLILEELSDLNIDPEEFPTTAARAARDRLEAAIGQLTAVSSALWR